MEWISRLSAGVVSCASGCVLALALALVSTGCGAGGEAGDPAPDPAGAWQLVGGAGPDRELETLDDHPVTLRFEDGRLGGTAACNSYGADVRIEGELLELGEFSQTEMACEPPAVMELESAYLDALRRVDRHRRDGDLLVLDGPSVELRFEPAPATPEQDAVGSGWELETLLSGEVASSPAAPATLRLDEDGTVDGDTGCRPFSGRYVGRGDEVVVTELTMDGDTEACSAAAAEQDRRVAEVLGDGFRPRVENDRLTLRSRHGGNGLVYAASP